MKKKRERGGINVSMEKGGNKKEKEEKKVWETHPYIKTNLC